MPFVVTAGRPAVPTITILIVCFALVDQVLVQIASRYLVVADFKSTVAVLVPSTYTYACPELEVRETIHATELPVKVQLNEASFV